MRKLEDLFYRFLLWLPFPKYTKILLGVMLIIGAAIGFWTGSVPQKLASGRILYHRTEYYWIPALVELAIGLYLVMRMWVLEDRINAASKAEKIRKEVMGKFTER